MKNEIKIFTALLLALNTMPVLAQEPCYEGELVNGKCKCDHTTSHPTLELYSKGATHYVKYNDKYDQCDERIYLDAPCIHKGHSDKPKDYQLENAPEKGYCIVIGKEYKRVRVRELVSEFNAKYNKGNGSVKAGEKILIVKKTKEITNPTELVDEFTSVGKYTSKQGQPSVRGILYEYNKLCKKNGDGFELVRANETNAVYYVCQGTKKTEDPKPEAKTEDKTEQSAQETSAVASAAAATGSGNDDNGVTLKKAQDGEEYFVGFKGNETSEAKEVLRSLADKYNSNFATYFQNGLPIGTDKVKFSWGNANLTNGFKKNPVWLELEKNYGILCNKNTQTKDGIRTLRWHLEGTKYVCDIKECHGTHKKATPPSSCIPIQSSTNSGTQESGDKPTDQEINNIVKLLERPVTLNTQIDIPEELRQEKKILYALQTWKNKCSAILKTIPDDNVEKRGVQTPSDNSFAKCFVQCKNDATYSTKQKKCVLINQDKQPTQKWEPNFAEAKLGNHINVPSEHIKEQVVIKWLDDANAAIAAAGGTNKVEETTDSNGETVYTCIILRCKDPKKVPNSNGTECIDAPEKLNAKSATLNPGAEKAGDVNISANAPTLTTEDLDNSKNRSKCEDDKDGDWDENQKKCLCANGSEIALDDDAVCQDEEEKPVAEEPVSEDPVVEPVAEEPVIAEQETPCDDQEVDGIIEEMAKIVPDENGNISIEYSVNYKTCDDLIKTWTDKCENGTYSKVENNDGIIKLTCTPKETNNDDNNSDIQDIINAFKNKANELKEKECATQTEQA